MRNELTLLIHSCEKFSDLWPAHFELLNKNWANRNIKTFLVTDEATDVSYDGVSIFSAGSGKELSERIESVLPLIQTEYVLVTLDDYFETEPINSNKIDSLIDVMEKETLDYICLFNRPKTNTHLKDYRNLFEVDLTRNYRVNLYPGLWRKSFMEKTIREPLNAWQYEVSLTKIAYEINARCALSKGNEYPILDVVRKGKILRKAHRYLEKHNLYHGNRAVCTQRDAFVLFVKTWIPRLLPNKLFRFIKKVLKIKSFS